MRNKIGTYEDAGFPNYPAPDAEGYPDKVDVSRRVRLVFANTPDYYETFRPYMDGENVPAIKNADGVMVANEKYKEFRARYYARATCPTASGSPTQLVLSSVYLRLQAIPLVSGEVLDRTSRARGVRHAVPIAWRQAPALGLALGYAAYWLLMAWIAPRAGFVIAALPAWLSRRRSIADGLKV